MKRQRPETGGRARRVGTAPARTVIFAIELYRHWISPLRLPCCRFTPTCSQYAVDAIGEYGLVRGSWLAAVRLAKCGPWHPGGWDPVPGRDDYGSGGGGDEPGTFALRHEESRSVV